MAQFVAALKIEIARLDDQLTRARALLASYEASAATERHTPAVALNGGGERHDRSRSTGENSKEQRVRRAVIELLRETGPKPRPAILEHLKAIGLMGHEAKPLRSLGSYLSRWPDDIESEGKGVWREREL